MCTVQKVIGDTDVVVWHGNVKGERNSLRDQNPSLPNCSAGTTEVIKKQTDSRGHTELS